MNNAWTLIILSGTALLSINVQGEPEIVSLDNDILSIPTSDSNDVKYSVLNDGMLNIAGGMVDFDIGNYSRKSHYLDDSVLSLTRGAVFSESVISSNNSISIVDSTLYGSINAEGVKAFGNLTAGGAAINGGINSGFSNQGNTVSLINSAVDGNARVIIKSARLDLKNTYVPTNNSAGITLTNVQCATIIDSRILGGSSNSSYAPGVNDISVTNNLFANLVNSEVISSSHAMWVIDSRDNILEGSKFYSSGGIYSRNSDITTRDTGFIVDAAKNNGKRNSPAVMESYRALYIQGGKTEISNNSQITINNVSLVEASREATNITMTDSGLSSKKDVFLINGGAQESIALIKSSNAVTEQTPRIRSQNNSVLIEADKAVGTQFGHLSFGSFKGYSDSSLKHDLGGKSGIKSNTVSVRSGLQNHKGWYIDSVLKVNHFNNQLRAQMNDGTPVNGDYQQNASGAMLEMEKLSALTESSWFKPNLSVSGVLAEGKSFSVDNGMKADVKSPRSMQMEGDIWAPSMTLWGGRVYPHAHAAISREFIKSNDVVLNERWSLNNRANEAYRILGAGVNSSLSETKPFYASLNLQQGRYIETPMSSLIGIDVKF